MDTCKHTHAHTPKQADTHTWSGNHKEEDSCEAISPPDGSPLSNALPHPQEATHSTVPWQSPLGLKSLLQYFCSQLVVAALAFRVLRARAFCPQFSPGLLCTCGVHMKGCFLADVVHCLSSAFIPVRGAVGLFIFMEPGPGYI